jgi:predicted DNA-binding protein (MmcQ/YjbR family)
MVVFGLPRRGPCETVHAPRVAADSAAGEIRRLALGFPEAYEDSPWGHPVFKVADNRMFAAMSELEGAVRLTVKLTAEEREIAMLLPYVEKAKYVGRYGWVTAVVRDAESLEAALEWLRESYWLRAPDHLRHAVEADD